jgi:tetratricopeptide (TPR) repeat protein
MTHARRATVTLLSLLVAVHLHPDGGRLRSPVLPADFGPDLLAREDQIRAVYLRVEQEMNQGRYEESATSLRGIVAIDPQHPLAYLGAALMKQRRGELGRSDRLLGAPAPSRGPGPDYGRATLLFLEGRDEEAGDLYARAAAGYTALGHPAGLAASQTGLGNCLLRLARHSKAREAYLTALSSVERLKDRRSVADLLSNLGNVEQMMGDDDTALEHYRRALAEREALGDRKGVAAALHNIAPIQRRRGDDHGALDSLVASLAIHAGLGDRAGEARNLNAIGLIHLDRGDFGPAAEAFANGLAGARQARDLRTQANALTNLGTVHGRTGRLQEALRDHLEALSLRRQARDRGGEAASLNNAASIREMMGDTQAALRLYESSLAIDRETGDRRAEAVVLVNLGRIRAGHGEQDEGLKALYRAEELFHAINDPLGEAGAQEEVGRILVAAGDYAAARAFLDRSVGLRRQARDRRGLASSLDGLGVLAGRLADFEAAQRFFEEALSIQREVNDRRAEGATIGHLANMYVSRGELARALRLHRQALEIHLLLGDPAGEATDLNNIGAVYQAIGDGETAGRYIQEALKRMRAAGNQAGEALARANLGVLLEDQGDREGALREYTESIRLRQTLGDVRGAAQSRLSLAEALAGVRRFGPARGALETALDAFRRIGDRAGEAMALGALGDLLRRQGRVRQSAEAYRHALAGAERLGMKEEIGRSEAGLAACQEAEGREDEALAGYDRAIAAVESVRLELVSPEFKSRYLARWVDLHESAVRLLWRLGRAAGGDGALQAARALSYAERSRARSLLDLLAESRADLRRGVDPALVRREAAAIAAMARTGPDLAATGNLRGEEALEPSLRRAEEELDLLKVEMRQSAPRYAALAYPVPAAAPEIQRSLLRPGERLLEYMLGEEASFLWVVTRDRLFWRQLPSRAILEAAVRPLLDRLRSRAADLGDEPSYRPLARRLGRLLLPEGVLDRGDRLVIVPDGILHYVPFETLIQPAPAEGQPERLLIEDHEIACAPSASALRLLRTPRAAAVAAPQAFLAFGDPVNEGPAAGTGALEPLPFARHEVQGIGALFPPGQRNVLIGSAATEDALKAADLESIRFLHFAAHAEMDEEAPGRSGIALARAPGGEEDGLLQMGEIFGLRLRADLAVLSACGSGRGRLARGEGLTGLTTAFLYAGARAVVVSLWSVSDRATSDLMLVFYHELLSGATTAGALRAAKLALLRSGRADERHPSRWAPFVLIGDPGNGSRKEGSAGPRRADDGEPSRAAADSSEQRARCGSVPARQSRRAEGRV